MSQPVEAMSVPVRPDRTQDPGAVSPGTAHLAGKRVAMVVFSYYPQDERVQRAAEALMRLGMEVDLICLQDRTEPKHETLNGVSIRRVPLSQRRSGVLRYVQQYSVFTLMSFAIVSLRWLKQGYDLVYVHNMPDVLVVTGLVPKLFGAKIVLDLHDPMPELMMTIFGLSREARSVWGLELLEKASIWFADRVVTVNRACERLFASRGCPDDKITVVMNSPDEEVFERAFEARAHSSPSPNGKFVVMYHGSLVERNGLALGVEALARFRASRPTEMEFRIYGPRNPYLDRVMESVRALGLDDCVRYLGPKSTEEIAEAVAECDLGIIPNQRNIFTALNTPTRIFEYLAMGKPVIAPRAPGIQHYFDEDSLLMFELGDAGDLAAKIEYVFANRDEAAGTTERGREVYLAHTWTKESAKLSAMLADLLDGKSVVSKVGQARGIEP